MLIGRKALLLLRIDSAWERPPDSECPVEGECFESYGTWLLYETRMVRGYSDV